MLAVEPKNLLNRLRAYFSQGQLRAQVFRGGVWLGAGTLSAQLLRLGRNVVLARLLSPESFGAMAIIISISSTMDTFTEIGIRESIIQNRDGCKDQYLNSAFWLSAIRAAVSYAAIFLLAPEVAHFYRNPELTNLGRVALSGVLFRGIMSPRAFVSLKLMDYKRWAFLQYGSSAAATIATILLAFVMRNVWALAIGFALECLVLCIASYFLFPFLPRFSYEKHSTRELLHFSRGVFGLSFLNLIYLRADIFVLGRLFPADQLGIYTMAIYIAQAMTVLVLNYQGQILMPVFSQLQSEHERTNAILVKGASLLALIMLPLLVFIAFSGRTLLAVLYGGRYVSGYWPFLIASFVGWINIANAQITTAFYAAGRPHLHRVCLLVMALWMIAFVYPAARYFGMAGAQLSALVAMVIGYAIQIRQLRALTGLRFTLRRISLHLAGAFLVLTAAVLLRGAVPSPAPWLSLLLGVCAAILTLLGGLALSTKYRFGIAAT